MNHKQDGRLALAYFSPNYKYFDQVLQTVKNETTVLNLVFKGFLQTSIPPLISILYAKEYHYFSVEIFCLKVPKKFVGEPFDVSEHFGYRKILFIRGDITIFCRHIFSHSTEKFRRGAFVFQKKSGMENFMQKMGISLFSVENFCLTVPKNFVVEPLLVSEKLWYRKFSCIRGYHGFQPC